MPALDPSGIWVSSQGEAMQGMVARQCKARHCTMQGKALHDAMQVKGRQCIRFAVYCASGDPVIIRHWFLIRIGALDQLHSRFVDASGFLLFDLFFRSVFVRLLLFFVFSLGIIGP